MAAERVKKQLLKRYIKDFKYEHTHCLHCHKYLKRITLVYRGEIISDEAIARFNIRIDEASWQAQRREWLALCRMCGSLHCKARCEYFDIAGFRRYLNLYSEISDSSQREYIGRLRRLAQHLSSGNVSKDVLKNTSLGQCPEPWLPVKGTQSYLVALRKYSEYSVHVEMGEEATLA
ncbi:flagella biosynthesis regulatory protein FliZ [Rahnella aquatilis]|nr:flagella biosynthesis regulatory protein FliZ [Rahnella aquatilis]QBJ09327.1 flagella biosynthesis regulatory protein FliZ [Rahnella aquatilis]